MNEKERSAIDGDDHGDNRAFLALRLGVERLAELHDVHPVLAQGRTDRGGRVRLPRRNLQLHHGDYFFCHWIPFLLF